MKELTIYIMASWKHHLAVELLSRTLEQEGHKIVSFVREGVKPNEVHKFGGFDDWVWSTNGREKFDFDFDGATLSDLCIYIGPSGTDAWAEIGAAFSRGVPVYGVTGKGEQAGLNRWMVQWCDNLDHLLDSIAAFAHGNLA